MKVYMPICILSNSTGGLMLLWETILNWQFPFCIYTDSLMWLLYLTHTKYKCETMLSLITLSNPWSSSVCDPLWGVPLALGGRQRCEKKGRRPNQLWGPRKTISNPALPQVERGSSDGRLSRKDPWWYLYPFGKIPFVYINFNHTKNVFLCNKNKYLHIIPH